MQPLDISRRLNRHCHCVGTDVGALHQRLDSGLQEFNRLEPLAGTHPHLFSPLPVFISMDDRKAMQTIVDAVEFVATLPAYRERVLAQAPAIARLRRGQGNAFLGYDFHLTDDGPKLIEINTNPGGALLNAEMLVAQRACCDEATTRLNSPDGRSLERILLDTFQEEWRRARGDAPLRTVAIVDEAPTNQYLYPEFLLFKKLFERHGIDALIVAPNDLDYNGGELRCGSKRIDLVYNRLTDFYFSDSGSRTLHEAYIDDAAVITPNPMAHAVYANKLNLTTLTDSGALHSIGVSESIIEALLQGIPRTESVMPHDRERWWTDRKRWFFKPTTGFGSRGTYRGDKVTRKVFDEILSGHYVAQAFSPPGERHQSGDAPLKFDVRCYSTDGHISLVAARLYQGQTTNFRTPRGGFAPIYTTADRFATARIIQSPKSAPSHAT